MSFHSINNSVLEKLVQYDTPTICNVVELFEIRPRNMGYMNQAIRCAFPKLPPMVGFAATATIRSSEPGSGGDVYETIERQFEQMHQLPGPSVIVFEDLDVPSVGATFGEVMCSSYQAFDSVGLISSGGGRDLEQMAVLNYPVFYGSTFASHAYSHIVELEIEVQVGGLNVANGDLMHGDGNGVTNIPIDIAAEVVDVADEYIAAEQQVIDYATQAGEKKVGEIVERRRAMSAAIGALRDRVSRNK